MNVQRWHPIVSEEYPMHPVMEEDSEGDYVDYQDYAKLQARVRELEGGIDVLHSMATATLAHPPENDTKVWVEIATITELLKGTP